VAKVDPPLAGVKWINENGMPDQYFFQLILDLWLRSGGTTDLVENVPNAGAMLARVQGLTDRLDDLEAEPRNNTIVIQPEPEPRQYLASLEQRIEDLEQQQR